MSPSQIEACKNRNRQLKEDIAAHADIAMSRAKRATEDIDNLLIDLDAAKKRASLEKDEAQRLRYDLAEAKKTNADLWRTVNPLRDKLAKARRLLKKYTLQDPTPRDKSDVKDIMKD